MGAPWALRPVPPRGPRGAGGKVIRAGSGRARSSRTALQHPRDRREEFLEVERLADVPVETRFGDLVAILLHHRRGHGNRRNHRRRRIGPQDPERVDAADSRKLDVHQDEIGMVFAGEPDPVLAGAGLKRGVALDLQHVANELEVLLIVFDYQYQAHGVLPWRCAPSPKEESIRTRDGPSRSSRQGYREGEDRPLARFAVDPDRPAVQLDKFA